MPPRQNLLFCPHGAVNRVSEPEFRWSQKNCEPDRQSGVLPWGKRQEGSVVTEMTGN